MTDPPWHFLDLDVPALHARSRGKGIRVAVLDSGVADGGGNFTSLRSFAADGACIDPLDDDGHGTACASLIASLSEDAPGIAPEAELISVRVCLGGALSESCVRQGLATAAHLGCDVISCSFVLPEVGPKTLDSIREITNTGTVIVAASGNDPNRPSAFPERTPNVLVVGPYNRERELVQSRFGLFTDVLAPGDDLPIVTRDGSIAAFGESSSAAAITAAIVAIVLGATRKQHVRLALEGLVKASASVGADGRRLLNPNRLLDAALKLC
jgi:subtilisin family serine protease